MTKHEAQLTKYLSPKILQLKAHVKEILPETACEYLKGGYYPDTDVLRMINVLKENHQIAEGFHTLLVSLDMPEAALIIEDAMAEGGQMIGTRVVEGAANDGNKETVHKGNTGNANNASMRAANDESLGAADGDENMGAAHGGSTGAKNRPAYDSTNGKLGYSSPAGSLYQTNGIRYGILSVSYVEVVCISYVLVPSKPPLKSFVILWL